MSTLRQPLALGSAIVLALAFSLQALGAAGLPPTEPPLPPEAGPVWDVAQAWTARSAARERFCLNGLWRFRSHTIEEPEPICADGFDDAKLSGWALTDLTPKACKAQCDTVTKKVGAGALRLDFDLPARVNFHHLTKEVAVKADTSYLLSAWVQTDLESGYITLEVQDVRNRFEGKTSTIVQAEASDRIAGKTAWQRVERPFRTKPGAARLRLLVRHYEGPDALKGTVRLDDLQIREKAEAPAGITPPSDDAWGFCKVPGSPKSPEMITYWNAKDPMKGKGASLRCAWYEREVTVPAAWAGRRIVLAIDRVSTELTLFCNGQEAGTAGWLGGEIDLTRWAKPGSPLRLTALVRGLDPGEVSELFAEGKVEAWQRRSGSCSIVGDVWLEAMPAAGPRVGPFLVQTRVQGMEISVRADLEGTADGGVAAGLTLLCQVRDGERVVKEFSAPIAAGTTSAKASAPWPEAELWDIGKPRLYHLSVSLTRDGKILDQSLPERFGFREFEIRGKFYYLNGVKINLHPCAYYVGQFYSLAPECISRWFDRILAEGRNFVYTESVDSPNRAEAILPVLRTADEKGVLMAVTPMQINAFWERLEEPAVRRYYENCLRTRAHRVWNHPSLALYRLNMNFDCYAQDQNPLVLDGQQLPPPETRLGKKFAAALASSAIMNGIDPSRRTYHHASGNMGDMYTLNNYLCWPVPQDLREWLQVWAERGTKPLMMVEFDLPYPGSFQMLDPTHWWCNEPVMTEYGAILLGERSYALEDDDFVDFCDLAWNREKKAWESSYGYFCGALAPILDECASAYYSTVLPAWRTWGISGGMNAWEYATVRAKKRAAKPSGGWGMRERPPDLPRPTAWAALQQPGFAPDVFTYDVRGNGHINTYQFPGLPSEAEYLEATQWGKVMPELLRPLYAYIAGPGADWPEQDHAYYVGETVRKSVVLINDRRQPATFTVRWSAVLDGKPVGQGTDDITVNPAEKGQLALEFPAPTVAARTAGEIRAEVTVNGTAVPTAAFAFQVYPKPATLTAPAGWFVYDPVGRTSAALAAVGLKLPAVPAAGIPASATVLLVGSEALGAGARPPFFRDLPSRLQAGMQVLFFEQTPTALESVFGLRAFTRATRQVWRRDAAHPFGRGLSNPDLADWRGRTTLGPLDGPPQSLDESQRAKRVWRCSQRGAVASTIVEKPHLGSFHPILDGEFDLRYMALWEVFEGRGRMVFCQMDVSDRLGKDPAADVLVGNLVASLGTWTAPKPTPTALVVSDTDLQEVLPLKLEAAVNPVLPPGPETLLVLGQGAGPWLFRNRAMMKEFFAKGGRAVAFGLDSDDAQVLALATDGALVLEEKTISTTSVPTPVPEVFRGVGPAEIHWRERRTVLAVTSVPANGWRTPAGTLARVPVGSGEIAWLSVAPSAFDPERRPDLIFSRVNTTRLLALTLTNAGARSGLTWTACLQAAEPLPTVSLAGLWRARQDPDALGLKEGWMKPELDDKDAAWTDMKQPGWFAETRPEWYGFLGDAWVRTHFKVPELYRHLPLEFFAKAIDDVDDVWLNGQPLGRTTRDTPQWWIAERHYRIPPGLLKFGEAENVLAVKINNNFMDAGVLESVTLGVPSRLDPFPVRHYLDQRVPRDDPYAYMRW